MNQPLLILDVSYLCHRAFHTQKGMSWKGRATGVIFGFLKSIGPLKDQFLTDRVAFCFESRESHRKKIYPDYKKKRTTRERTPEEQKSYEEFVEQIVDLKTRYLPQIGFNNCFCYPGYESDDIMAAIASNLGSDDSAIIVTADHDLYQCIRSNVIVFNPQQADRVDVSAFVGRYGIRPHLWAMSKAIAGCHSDEVKGVPGVGEITALKFLRGELDPESKAHASILSPEGKAIVRRNRKLVELPFDGCPTPRIQEDCVCAKAWRRVCEELGMRSIAGHPPIAIRAQRKMK